MQVDLQIDPDHVFLSEEEYDLRSSHYVPGRAFEFSCEMDNFANFMDQFDGEEDGYLRFFAGGIVQEDSLQICVQDMFEADWVPIATADLQSDVSKAMSTSIKCVLNDEVTRLPQEPNVLVIGSGFGNDVKRVSKALASSGRDKFKVVAIEPNDTRIRQSKAENPDVVHICADYEHGFEKVRFYGPFDLILGTMSTQHIIGQTNFGAGSLADLLAPDGVFLGSYFDHDSYFSLLPSVLSEVGASIMVGHLVQDTNMVLGYYPCTISGKTFEDPYVNGALVAKFAADHNLDYRNYRGRAVLKRFAQTVKRSARSYSSTIGLVSIVRMCHVQSLEFSLDTVGLPPIIKPACIIQVSDLLHLRVGHYVLSPKLDGIRRIAHLANGKIIIGELTYPSVSYKHACTLQLEETNEAFHLVDVQFEHWIDVPFPRRYAVMVVLASLLCLPKPVLVNEFFLPLSAADLFGFFLKVRSCEGFMVGNLTSHCPGLFSDFLYVKQRPTIDIAGSSGIEEHFVTRSGPVFFRPRPDKAWANPLTQLVHTRESPAYDFVLRVLLQHACDVPISGYLEELLQLADFSSCGPAQVAQLTLASHLIPRERYWEFTGLLQTLGHERFKTNLQWDSVAV